MSDGDDETCGWETPNGPCQNPPSEGEYCWIRSHGDPNAENRAGRPFTITEDDHEDILDAARAGLSETGCARAAGTDWPQLNRYLEKHPKFRSAFARARQEGERKLAEGGLKDPDIDSSMAKFLLSTSFDYVKTERRELTGEDGGPVELDVDDREKEQLEQAFDEEPQT